MIQVDDGLWTGNSADAEHGNISAFGALLNVARDLRKMLKWSDDVEYAQVGLVDGPGNEVGDYLAAALTLNSLLKRHDSVLVYDHDGGRALTVAAVYLQLREGQRRPKCGDPTAWGYWPTWENRLASMYAIDDNVHTAHREVFARIPFGLLGVLL